MTLIGSRGRHRPREMPKLALDEDESADGGLRQFLCFLQGSMRALDRDPKWIDSMNLQEAALKGAWDLVLVTDCPERWSGHVNDAS